MYQALSAGNGLVAAYGFEHGNLIARTGPSLGPNGSYTYQPRQLVTSDPAGRRIDPSQQYPPGRMS